MNTIPFAVEGRCRATARPATSMRAPWGTRSRSSLETQPGGSAGRSRAGPRKMFFVKYDRCVARTHFGGKSQRVRFQRQMLTLPADDIELVAVAWDGMGNEQLPITEAAHAHRMSSRIPEVEIADHAHSLRVWRQHDERHAFDPFQRKRVRAELVVKPQMVALAEQVQIVVRQHRGEALGVIEIDDGVAEARAQLIGF